MSATLPRPQRFNMCISRLHFSLTFYSNHPAPIHGVFSDVYGYICKEKTTSVNTTVQPPINNELSKCHKILQDFVGHHEICCVISKFSLKSMISKEKVIRTSTTTTMTVLGLSSSDYMSVMASENIGNSTICSTVQATNNWKNTTNEILKLHHTISSDGNPSLTDVSSDRRLLMWCVFSCHDVTMTYTCGSEA